MANDEQLALLKAGVAGWNAWRIDNEDEDVDLRSADLAGADLAGANLNEADLTSAKLGSANLSGADLSEAILRGASMESVNLSGANLSEVARVERAEPGMIGATKPRIPRCFMRATIWLNP